MLSLPFSKSSHEDKKTQETVGFEPEEQPTPLLGRLLLILLAFLLLFFGWRGLEDLGNIPQKPEALSDCFVYVGTSTLSRGELRSKPRIALTSAQNFPTYYLSSSTTCSFSSYEIQAGVPAPYQTAKNAYGKVETAQTNLSSVQTQLRQYESQYNISLLEKIADEQALDNTPPEIRDQVNFLRQQESTAKSQLDAAQNELDATLSPLMAAYKKAQDAYEHAWAGYKFWVFLLEVTFVVPFFVGSMWFYRRLHGKSSPHTIISVPIVVVSSILLARVLLVYFWNLFLADLAEFLWKIFAELAIFRTLIYYVGMILAVVIFGGAVYKLQKQIFAPQRVRARRLRANKCPYCEFSLDLTKSFCPGCGKQLMVACKSCGQPRYIDMQYCPNCGKL